MKTEKEILNGIVEMEKVNKHVLDCYPASVTINAPRALMQLAATSKIDALCWVLGISRKKYKCDDFKKLDH
jgi:hypothetical protein